MSRMSIIAVATGAKDDQAAIAAAADFAARHQSTAKVVAFVPVPIGPAISPRIGGAAVAAQVWESMEEQRDAVRAQIGALVVAEVQRLGEACLTMVEMQDWGWASLMAELPLADLAFVAQSSVAGPGPWTGPLGEALIEGRAPVYVSRTGPSPVGRPAAVAWDGSLEAGRAVKAALPLLAEASRVIVLQDQDGLDTTCSAQADPARVAGYLHLHGIEVAELKDVRGRRIGPSLLAAAKAEGAGLLVAGAYRHSRLGEVLFGGATRSFLHEADGPHLLIAH